MKQPMNPHEVMVERRGGLIEAEVDGELVALHVENGKCYGFNGTATRIWYLLEEQKTLAQLCARLAQEYEMAGDGCETEVLEFLHELEADGLVKLGSATVGTPDPR